ncbi:MAG: FkbM family methyltransferase [Chloroflexi bacterium]|nr:FkbM family methyltransferase [Chloroflexota bacterium]
MQVKVDTLDDYCARNAVESIDYLKIDVEGYEMEVMLGAESLLSSGQIGLIHFEYGDQWMNARRYLARYV